MAFRHKTEAVKIGDPKPTPKEKKVPTPLKRSPIKKKYKATGEAEMFKEIWEERPHVCTNCKVPLGNEAKTWFFAHIHSKKQYPELRLIPANIRLLCFECHQQYDQGTKESFEKRFNH